MQSPRRIGVGMQFRRAGFPGKLPGKFVFRGNIYSAQDRRRPETFIGKDVAKCGSRDTFTFDKFGLEMCFKRHKSGDVTGRLWISTNVSRQRRGRVNKENPDRFISTLAGKVFKSPSENRVLNFSPFRHRSLYFPPHSK